MLTSKGRLSADCQSVHQAERKLGLRKVAPIDRTAADNTTLEYVYPTDGKETCLICQHHRHPWLGHRVAPDLGIQAQGRQWGRSLACRREHASGSGSRSDYIYVRLECELLRRCPGTDTSRTRRNASKSRSASSIDWAAAYIRCILFWRTDLGRGTMNGTLEVRRRWLTDAGYESSGPRREPL